MSTCRSKIRDRSDGSTKYPQTADKDTDAIAALKADVLLLEPSMLKSLHLTRCITSIIRCRNDFHLIRPYSSQLPSDAENARSNLSKRLTSQIDKLQTSLLFAGQRLNDLTGYSGIEKLKKRIELQEDEVLNCVQRVRASKSAYDDAIRVRSASQREVNELLQRKSSWSTADLERFTTLFRNDHSNSQNEERCQSELSQAEVQVDHARTELGNMILARYHEEQIWSDKIRRA